MYSLTFHSGFFLNNTATSEIYPLPLHDALPICVVPLDLKFESGLMRARVNPKDGQLYVCGIKGWQTSGNRDGCQPLMPQTRSEEHTSELQSLTNIVCRLLLVKYKHIK